MTTQIAHDIQSTVAVAGGVEPLRVALVISSLDHGGAERQVVELANRLEGPAFRVFVVSLSDHVPLADRLANRSRRLVVIRKRAKFDISTVWRLESFFRQQRIQVAHAFLFDAEIAVRLAARKAGVTAVVASERNTDYQRSMLHQLCHRLTRPFYDAMIANSLAGKRFNVRTLGLPPSRIHVVRNGVDVDLFSPRPVGALRDELGIGVEERLVGMVASFKTQKRHGDFFRMASIVLEEMPNVRFLCVGEPLRGNLQGSGEHHARMLALVRELGIEERFLFLGRRNDMPSIYSLCDMTVLTSEREGTPNVLLESMACGVPVAATDIADNAQIVREGQTGFIVPLGDYRSMAQRALLLLGDEELRNRMGRRAHEWVSTEFSTDALARRTGAIYQALVNRKHGSPAHPPEGGPA